MDNQNDISKRMRIVLVNWIIDVHRKWKLREETLFLTINLIDRYCEKVVITRMIYQLVGITSMLVASKYEEIYAPDMQDCVYITDEAYTRAQLLKMEQDLLFTLDFNLTAPSALRLL